MVDISNAAQIIGLSVHTMKAWVVMNKIPFIREGGRTFFKEADCILIRNLMRKHGSDWRTHFNPVSAQTAAEIARRLVNEEATAFLNQKRGTK